MSEPDVTVIVPAFDTMPYLTRCLGSLVSQSLAHERFEVVVVDDGSTDGTGQEAERFAAAHPALFTVVHQPNSGGPASPCNAGLDLSHGRYVFFLGADDYLGDEALERMVAKADEWGSDVLCGRLVGVGGRWVNQALFEETRPDVPFPSRLLASALSNTKLFRRSMIEAHSLRFPEDLRIGSDQPFTIAALLHARRVSVLADYEYYHAVRRDDASNLTYTSTWRTRATSISAVVRHVADLLEPGEGRDAILHRHFSGEWHTLLRRDLPSLGPDERGILVQEVAGLSRRFLSAELRKQLKVRTRLRYELAEAGAVEDLVALAEAEESTAQLRLDGHCVYLRPRGTPDHVPDDLLVVTVDSLRTELDRSLGPVSATFEGTRLRLVAAASRLHPDSAPFVHLKVSPCKEGQSWGPRETARRDHGRRLNEVTIAADGRLETTLDCASLTPTGPQRQGVWALRVQCDVGDTSYVVPLRGPADAPAASEQWEGPGFSVRQDRQGRLLLASDASEAVTTSRAAPPSPQLGTS